MAAKPAQRSSSSTSSRSGLTLMKGKPVANGNSADVGRVNKFKRRNGQALERNVGPRIGDKELALLRDLIENEGLNQVARWIGISGTALLYCMAGLSDRQRHDTLHKIRGFFRDVQI